ncbi:MAG: transglutaminase-like domain-containing protein [Verrucomicrobia bacterium]|nr:transglutaminase-like domain-containing protein [Verrucomicrobiota bacterium]
MSSDRIITDKGAVPSVARQQALLTLLADEDCGVVEAIREQLTPRGRPQAWLKAHRVHPDPVIRARVRELWDAQARMDADREFLEFCAGHGEHFDLEEAVWKLAKTRNPEAPIEAYQAQLDWWAQAAEPAVELASDGGEVISALNAVLFGKQGFRGDTEHYFDPENSYLDRVIDRRRGIPITLCCLYQFVARRLGLPVVGIGMPGHFLCRYQDAQGEWLIDAFHAGRLVTRSEARQRLAHFALPDSDSAILLQPISPRRCLQRMIANVHVIYQKRRDAVESRRLQQYLVLLSR